MLLKDSFYTILSDTKTETGFRFEIEIDKNHAIFEGHFPENPVTPGVVQMEIVKELLKYAKNRSLTLSSMPSCKFLAILNPQISSKISVDLELKDETEEGFRVNASFLDENTAYLKMTAIYRY